MVRTDRFKLILIPKKPEPIWELYDLEADPSESRNLIASPPSGSEELRTLLLASSHRIRWRTMKGSRRCRPVSRTGSAPSVTWAATVPGETPEPGMVSEGRGWRSRVSSRWSPAS